MHGKLIHRLPIAAAVLVTVAWLVVAIGALSAMFASPMPTEYLPGHYANPASMARDISFMFAFWLAIGSVLLSVPNIVAGVRRRVSVWALLAGGALIVAALAFA